MKYNAYVFFTLLSLVLTHSMKGMDTDNLVVHNEEIYETPELIILSFNSSLPTEVQKQLITTVESKNKTEVMRQIKELDKQLDIETKKYLSVSPLEQNIQAALCNLKPVNSPEVDEQNPHAAQDLAQSIINLNNPDETSIGWGTWFKDCMFGLTNNVLYELQSKDPSPEQLVSLQKRLNAGINECIRNDIKTHKADHRLIQLYSALASSCIKHKDTILEPYVNTAAQIFLAKRQSEQEAQLAETILSHALAIHSCVKEHMHTLNTELYSQLALIKKVKEGRIMAKSFGILPGKDFLMTEDDTYIGNEWTLVDEILKKTFMVPVINTLNQAALTLENLAENK